MSNIFENGLQGNPERSIISKEFFKSTQDFIHFLCQDEEIDFMRLSDQSSEKKKT